MNREEYRRTQIKKIVDKYGVPGAGDDFDPDRNRDIAHPTTYFETMFHVVKGSLGTGLLAMPIAFKYSGIAAGFVCSVFTTIACTYGIQIFFRSQYKISKKLKTRYMPYRVIMRAALLSGPEIFTNMAVCLSSIVDGFLILYQMGVCASYIIFMADNIKDMYELYHKGINLPVELYMLMLFVPLLIISSVPNMKVMSKFSLVSNLLTIASAAVMIVIMAEQLPPISTWRHTGKPLELPLTFGIVLFAISAIAIFLAAEKDMEKPEQMVIWWGTLNVSMTFICVLYSFIGFIGFWKYGENVKDSISLNLDESNKNLALFVQILLCIAIYITYGLNAMIPVDMIWNTYLDEPLAEWRFHACGIWCTRILVVVVSTAFAACLPLFGDMLSLLGAFGMSCMELIFPPMIHVCVNWPNDLGRCKWVLILDLFLAMVGLFGMGVGTFSSILSIRKHLKELREGKETS